MRKTPSQHFADMSQAPVPERIHYVRTGAFFETSAIRALRDRLDELIREPVDCENKLVFITAPAGMGLTRIIKQFAAQHPPKTSRRRGRHTVPLVNQLIHPSGDFIDYCDALRTNLDIPGYGAMTRRSSYPKTLELLGHLKTRLVILEDFHRAYSFQKHQLISYQNYVHYLISEYDIRVILTGAPRIWRWALEDEQTLGRSVHLQYRAWTPSEDDFIEFLEGFERWCPVREEGALSRDPKLRKAIISRTHGICKSVMQVLTGLAIYAIVSGSERLDFDTWISFRDQGLSI
ncbi:TniB family NTP-binding protein (plasmid) [Leisingera sp. M527]|uniref:TniB family NTP-binding protein n=1 Tax=unclassified Leisingera TaxID=2614906 RepID=UPI0021A7368F|nr:MULTISPECIES: TniB family NTP-binding protein [unclassified Leisingera]UWQ35605.1 TniB family NTP-binding protein [Leisingera sp. M527]UWQ77306.1 TniB family NTP-binding protein [Leisingera sp. M658]